VVAVKIISIFDYLCSNVVYRRDLTKTVNYIKGILSNTKDADVHWDDFDASMPQTDSAAEYVAANPERFFIPFEQEFKTLHQRFHVIPPYILYSIVYRLAISAFVP
jgi:hypothetical protein